MLQPVFHGFGWKGLRRGRTGRATRGVRALLPLPGRPLRRPAGGLPGRRRRLRQRAADRGRRPGGAPLGRLRAAHRHPLPAALHAPTRTRTADWLDFQWCQTGHQGDHVPERVADMWRNSPAAGGDERGADLRADRSAPATAPAGGRATRPGATCAPAGRWASCTVRAACGSGGSTPTSRAMRYFLAAGRRLAGGARLPGQPLRRPGREDPGRPADRQPPAVLGPHPDQPRAWSIPACCSSATPSTAAAGTSAIPTATSRPTTGWSTPGTGRCCSPGGWGRAAA